jgi:hypothetical protein
LVRVAEIDALANDAAGYPVYKVYGAIILDAVDDPDMGVRVVFVTAITVAVIGVMEKDEVAYKWIRPSMDTPPITGEVMNDFDAVVAGMTRLCAINIDASARVDSPCKS